MSSAQFFFMCSKSPWPLFGRDIYTRLGVDRRCCAWVTTAPGWPALGWANKPPRVFCRTKAWTAAGTNASLFKSRSIPVVRRGGAWCTGGREHKEEERRLFISRRRTNRTMARLTDRVNKLKIKITTTAKQDAAHCRKRIIFLARERRKNTDGREKETRPTAVVALESRVWECTNTSMKK